MSQDDQLRRRADAEALLRHPSWTSDEIDHAVALHDLLESPDLPPDPVLVSLRSRLGADLRRRSERSSSVMDLIRAEIFSLGWLDSPDPFRHRLVVLHYQGFTSFMNFQTGATGHLDRAISVLAELDRAVQEGGDAARALLGDRYDSALLSLAAACYVRYHRQRELLLLDQPPDSERRAIEADLDLAVDACERVLRIPGSSSRPAAMATLGSCYALGYELHARYRNPKTIDSAIDLLREALRLTGTGSSPAEVTNRTGIMDRLASALLIRDRLQDVDEAIELLTAAQAETAYVAGYRAGGGAASMATALVQRWMHTHDEADEERARAAYVSAFASNLDVHLPTAIDVATQRGGWAWGEGWWAEAGEAYGQAVDALHLAVRRQANREERELILLLQCGLTGVVGTLWAASDRAAAMVMEAFYQEWQGHGAHPAQALRRAQQQVRGGRFASPLFWAPFVYVGP
jgi:CHAT domain-containing protein